MKAKSRTSGQNWEFDGSIITVRIPMTWKRRGGRKMIIALDGGDAWAPAKPRPNETLARWRAHIGGSGYWKMGSTGRQGSWPRPRTSNAASSIGSFA